MVLGAIGFLIYQVGRIRSFGIIRMNKSEEEYSMSVRELIQIPLS